MNYVLLGAGYVAPKHYNAIKETGGNLLAILDPHDSVGILDSYFPDCKYFSEFEVFDRFCTMQDIDYCVICSPNYLHDAHSRFGLRIGADVICEKPLALNERNLEGLCEMEEKTGHRIWNILQLRLGTASAIDRQGIKEGAPIVLDYCTPRGSWYEYSWKGDIAKSGGLVTNIGIHLFDMLLWLFGPDYEIINWKNDKDISFGVINIGGHLCSIILSIGTHKTPTRSLSIGLYDLDLSVNFNDLHVESYKRILSGEGFGIEEAIPAIKLCEQLREDCYGEHLQGEVYELVGGLGSYSWKC